MVVLHCFLCSNPEIFFTPCFLTNRQFLFLLGAHCLKCLYGTVNVCYFVFFCTFRITVVCNAICFLFVKQPHVFLYFCSLPSLWKTPVYFLGRLQKNPKRACCFLGGLLFGFLLNSTQLTGDGPKTGPKQPISYHTLFMSFSLPSNSAVVWAIFLAACVAGRSQTLKQAEKVLDYKKTGVAFCCPIAFFQNWESVLDMIQFESFH